MRWANASRCRAAWVHPPLFDPQRRGVDCAGEAQEHLRLLNSSAAHRGMWRQRSKRRGQRFGTRALPRLRCTSGHRQSLLESVRLQRAGALFWLEPARQLLPRAGVHGAPAVHARGFRVQDHGWVHEPVREEVRGRRLRCRGNLHAQWPVRAAALLADRPMCRGFRVLPHGPRRRRTRLPRNRLQRWLRVSAQLPLRSQPRRPTRLRAGRVQTPRRLRLRRLLQRQVRRRARMVRTTTTLDGGTTAAAIVASQGEL